MSPHPVACQVLLILVVMPRYLFFLEPIVVVTIAVAVTVTTGSAAAATATAGATAVATIGKIRRRRLPAVRLLTIHSRRLTSLARLESLAPPLSTPLMATATRRVAISVQGRLGVALKEFQRQLF